MFKSRLQDLEFLIEQRLIFKNYLPDELYGVFSKSGLDYSVSEIIEASISIKFKREKEEQNRKMLEALQRHKSETNQ